MRIRDLFDREFWREYAVYCGIAFGIPAMGILLFWIVIAAVT